MPSSLDDRSDLAQQLRDEYESATPDLDGVFGDLLRAAVSAVNWYEIADNLMSEAAEILGDESDESDEGESGMSAQIPASARIRRVPWSVVDSHELEYAAAHRPQRIRWGRLWHTSGLTENR